MKGNWPENLQCLVPVLNYKPIGQGLFLEHVVTMNMA